MPNRILREGILTSERVNELSLLAELFYRRLMSIVDDYGRYSAHPPLLRAACYPLRVDTVGEADISQYLAALKTAGLISLYCACDKPFLEIHDFKQRRRAASKCPAPPHGPPSAAARGQAQQSDALCRQAPPSAAGGGETGQKTPYLHNSPGNSANCAESADLTAVRGSPRQSAARARGRPKAKAEAEAEAEAETEARERARARGLDALAAERLSLEELSARISQLRTSWVRQPHQWTEYERQLLISLPITESDMRRIEEQFAAGKGKAKKLRYLLEHWTDELEDDPQPTKLDELPEQEIKVPHL